MNKSNNLIESVLGLDIRLQRLVYAHWPAYWAEMKWPVGAIRALLMIESQYARTPKEVADILKVGKTTVTGMLDRLETDGLITRTLDLDDRRSFVLELTDAGRELVRQIDGLRRDALEQALAAMDFNDLRMLHKGLEALTEAMDINQEKALP